MNNDTISRQAAIDALCKRCDLVSDDEPCTEECNDIKILKLLPFAQPEQKKGKWIIKDNPETGWYRVTCSECGEDVTSTIPMIGFFPNAKPLWDYCPYCGADMRGEQDD